jgi:hypothetical protein
MEYRQWNAERQAKNNNEKERGHLRGLSRAPMELSTNPIATPRAGELHYRRFGNTKAIAGKRKSKS